MRPGLVKKRSGDGQSDLIRMRSGSSAACIGRRFRPFSSNTNSATGAARTPSFAAYLRLPLRLVAGTRTPALWPPRAFRRVSWSCSCCRWRCPWRRAGFRRRFGILSITAFSFWCTAAPKQTRFLVAFIPVMTVTAGIALVPLRRFRWAFATATIAVAVVCADASPVAALSGRATPRYLHRVATGASCPGTPAGTRRVLESRCASGRPSAVVLGESTVLPRPSVHRRRARVRLAGCARRAARDGRCSCVRCERWRRRTASPTSSWNPHFEMTYMANGYPLQRHR